MNVPIEAWQIFYDDFGVTVRTWLEEQKLKGRLKEVEDELRHLKAVPDKPPEEEFKGLRAIIKDEIDQAEADTLRQAVRQNAVLNRLIENRRSDLKVGNHHCTTRTAIFDRAWRQHEVAVSGITDFDGLRKLFACALALERDRIRQGEIEDISISPQEKKKLLKKLEAERSKIKDTLASERLNLPWRFSTGHPRRDHLEAMVREYLSAQRNASFPVDPQYRIKTSAAWGNITDASDPAAKSITLAPEHLEAWRELKDFVEENHGRSN
jgi:hypothetical protein